MFSCISSSSISLFTDILLSICGSSKLTQMALMCLRLDGNYPCNPTNIGIGASIISLKEFGRTGVNKFGHLKGLIIKLRARTQDVSLSRLYPTKIIDFSYIKAIIKYNKSFNVTYEKRIGAHHKASINCRYLGKGNYKKSFLDILNDKFNPGSISIGFLYEVKRDISLSSNSN